MLERHREGGRSDIETGKTVRLHLLKLGTIASMIAAIYLFGALHGLQLGAAAQTHGLFAVPPTKIGLPFPVNGMKTYFPTATVLEYTEAVSLYATISALCTLCGALLIYLSSRGHSDD
jgi:hypothetical protein